MITQRTEAPRIRTQVQNKQLVKLKALYTPQKLSTLKPGELGEHFEQVFESFFKVVEVQEPLTITRLKDSKTARNITSANPGDFYILHQGVSFLVELKASLTKLTPDSTMLRGSQRAGALQHIRAGGVALLAFLNFDGTVDFYDTVKVIKNQKQESLGFVCINSKAPDSPEVVSNVLAGIAKNL